MGVYSVYGEKEYDLFVFACSWSKTTPGVSSSIAPKASPRNKKVTHNIHISQPNNTNKLTFVELKASPENTNGEWSLGVGTAVNSNGELQNTVTVTRTYKDIEIYLNSDNNKVEDLI